MNWLLFAVVALLGWGCADVFYKKSADENDRWSHLKVAVWVGLVMGVVSLCLIPFSETLAHGEGSFLSRFAVGTVKYAPASLCYIASMIIGYAGMRYLEISIISPVQNASGVLSAICIIAYMALTGNIAGIGEAFSPLYVTAMVLIVAGVVALAVVENKLSAQEAASDHNEGKYRFGALALLFPILYCVFDTVGTAADGVILDEEAGLGLGEIDVLVLYGVTFLLAGFVCWLVLRYKTKQWYNPFAKSEWPKGVAAACEEFGQIFYVYAMAANAVYAAPVVASYCIVSLLLSRAFLKEKLKVSQYVCVFLVIAGIVILGFLDA